MSKKNKPPSLLNSPNKLGFTGIQDGMAFNANNLNNAINNAVTSLNEKSCEPIRSSVREYLDDKGVEYETGTFTPHKIAQMEDASLLQIELENISERMFMDVIGVELSRIAHKSGKELNIVVMDGDHHTYQRVIVRFE